MRRIPIQIDEETYEALRKKAFEQNRSIAAIVRDCLAGLRQGPAARSIRDFPFVGAGRSRAPVRDPVSEQHDRALAAATRKSRRHR